MASVQAKKTVALVYIIEERGLLAYLGLKERFFPAVAVYSLASDQELKCDTYVWHFLGDVL